MKFVWCLFLLTCASYDATAFAPIFSTSTVVNGVQTTKQQRQPDDPFAEPEVETLPTNEVVTKVAVAGATGRTGRLVVEELLNRGVSNVVAIVRNTDKANEIFTERDKQENLEIIKCDLANDEDVRNALQGVDAAIWCATGFSNNPDANILQKIQNLFTLIFGFQKSIDLVGLPAFAKAIPNNNNNNNNNIKENDVLLPKIVMLSSAGVTRTIWSKEKQKKFVGAADIPIVRLNPFNILDRKRESEDKLRTSGVPYCICRPGGLNDNWPSNSRPLFTQGDVAVGRINRKDVASVLVDVLSCPEATGKTFEVIALTGYTKPRTIAPALSRLQKDDDENTMSEDALYATYIAMQQLLPGEVQDSAALAMGQTYEQLDAGKEGRLGRRGTEDAEGQINPTS